MGNIYIAVNGDDVGSRIGEAIANDDHEGLAQASSSIQGAHDSIDQWVNSIGGKKVTSAGDDAIYLVPEQAVNDIDEIREQYKQESGHGLTVGVGPSMSQASKALIYGKLNGKDQTIHYEPMIEDYLSEEDEDAVPEIPEEDEVQGQADADMEQDAGTGALDAPPQDDAQADGVDVGSEELGQDAAPAPGADDASSGEDDDAPPAGTEDDIADDNQAATSSPAAPAANKTPAQAAGPGKPDLKNKPIDDKTDKDFGTSSDDLSQDPAQSDDGEDGDLPDNGVGAADTETDADQDVDAAVGDDDDSGAPPTDSAADDASPDEMDGSSTSDESTTPGQDDAATLSDDDVASQDDGSEEPADDGQDPLASMIHGDMQEGGDDSAQDPDADPAAGGDSTLDDELRQDIAQALVSFKENKDMLEEARETNPELYNATLTMLRSMIAMAKKLGFGPEQDMADKEAEQQLDQEFPAADEGGAAPAEGEEPAPDEGGEDEEAGDDAPPAPSEKKGPSPAKK